MMGNNPNDPRSMLQIIKDTYVAGIDAGRAVRDAEAKREVEMAYGSGFKNGFDEGAKKNSVFVAKMAKELLDLREKKKKRKTKRDTGKVKGKK